MAFDESKTAENLKNSEAYKRFIWLKMCTCQNNIRSTKVIKY